MSPCARHLPVLEQDLFIGHLEFQLDSCSGNLQGLAVLPVGNGVERRSLGEGALDIFFPPGSPECGWRDAVS